MENPAPIEGFETQGTKLPPRVLNEQKQTRGFSEELVEARVSLDNEVASQIEKVGECLDSFLQKPKEQKPPEESDLEKDLERARDILVAPPDDESLISSSTPVATSIRNNTGFLRSQENLLDGKVEDYSAEIDENRQKLRDLEGKGLLTRLKRGKEISQIKREIEKLELEKERLTLDLSTVQRRTQSADAVLQKLSEKREDALIKVVEDAVAQITQKYEEFREVVSGNEDLKRELNEELIDLKVKPIVEKLVSEGQIPEQIGQEYLNLVRGQLNNGVEPQAEDSPERKQVFVNRNERIKEITSLPDAYELKDIQYRIGTYLPSAEFRKGNEGYGQIIELIARNEACEALRKISLRVQGSQIPQYMIEELEHVLARRFSPELPVGRKNQEEKPQALDFSAVPAEDFVRHLMGEVAVQRWEVIVTSELVNKIFGEGAVQRLKDTVRNKIISDLVKTPEHTDRSIGLGYRLLLFKDAQAVPLAILNSWREPGYSGEQPFLSVIGGLRHTKIYKYISLLPDEEIEKLKAFGIPGTAEIVKLIRENPDSYCLPFVESSDWRNLVKVYSKKYDLEDFMARDELSTEREHDPWIQDRINDTLVQLGLGKDVFDFNKRHVPNPIYEELQKNLTGLCFYYLGENKIEAKFFAFGTLARLDLDFTKEQCEGLEKLFIETKDERLQDGILKMIKYRGRDTEAVLSLLRVYPNLEKQFQEKVRKTAPEFLERFLISGKAVEAGNIELFGNVLGKDVKQIQIMVDFVRSVRSFYPHESWKSFYDHERLQDYIKLSENLEYLSLIKELASYGYDFDIKHFSVFPEILRNRELIVDAIKHIRSLYPNFKYQLTYDFKFNSDTKESEQFYILNPYEILIRGIRWENLGNAFGSIYQKEGKLDRKFSDGLLRRVKGEINESSCTIFNRALEKLVGFSLTEEGKALNFSSFYSDLPVFNYLARFPDRVEVILNFPKEGKNLLERKETRTFVVEKGEILLKDVGDLRFLNRLAKEYSSKADFMIRAYEECLRVGAITSEDKNLVLEFLRQFRIIAPVTIRGYKEAKGKGYDQIYIAQLKSVVEKMSGQGRITEEERKRPYFQELLRHVYPNNSGHWTTYENNESCSDRSQDIAGFKIKPRYVIDLLTQSIIRVREGETIKKEVLEEMQQPVYRVFERMKTVSLDREKTRIQLEEEVGKRLAEIVNKGGLDGLEISQLSSLEEKLFLILVDSVYGSKVIPAGTVKDLFITYEFTTYQDVSDYIAGTRDRVSQATNQDYALLCELSSFYADRIKEVNRVLVQTAWQNTAISSLMQGYFKKISQETVRREMQNEANRLQIYKLGLTDSFVERLGKVLEKRNGRKYTHEQVRSIIRKYEGIAGGLTEKTSSSGREETKQLYGQLKSQRDRTLAALSKIAGQDLDPKKVFLGEINLEEALKAERNIRDAIYDEEQFASYTTQKLIDIFGEEREKIQSELEKFESISGKQREVVYGYISKTKESAHARMVGGVCVCGDNPKKSGVNNMWDMPNYFQLVLQDSDTLQCQGIILLHHFEENSKRVLTASLDPSSTYLYSVDESALFSGVMTILEDFAKDNGFDTIAVSKNHTIRTNRTGTIFEGALDKRVAKIGKSFEFSEPKRFSYNPSYQIDKMDVIWEESGSQLSPA